MANMLKHGKGDLEMWMVTAIPDIQFKCSILSVSVVINTLLFFECDVIN